MSVFLFVIVMHTDCKYKNNRNYTVTQLEEAQATIGHRSFNYLF